MNYLILNSSSLSRDYLLILLHTHLRAHTIVANLHSLCPYPSITLKKWVVFLLHEILEVRLFPFVLVETCFVTSFKLILNHLFLSPGSKQSVGMSTLLTRARYNLDTFKVERIGAFCFCTSIVSTSYPTDWIINDWRKYKHGKYLFEM